MANIKKECIVKRKGHQEAYDNRKVYASVYAAALNCHYSEKKAEKIASQITKKIAAWIKGKGCVDSKEIRKNIISNLEDEDVALMYKHHLDLS